MLKTFLFAAIVAFGLNAAITTVHTPQAQAGIGDILDILEEFDDIAEDNED